MASEETTQQETTHVDSAMEKFYEFLPESEKSGESPDAGGGEGTTEPDGNAQAEGTQESKDSGTEQSQNAGDGGEQDNTGDQPTFDVNKYLEESSGGLFKTEDDFKGALSKITEFDNLSKQIEVLKAEKENMFADDFVKTLNSLRKEGKSQEQIDGYINLSRMDLSTMDAKEALVQDQVLNHGHTRAIAERIISKKYGLDKLSFDEDTLSEEEIADNKAELETVQAIMKNDAKPVVEAFQNELKGLVDSVSPEQKALEEAARKKSYEKALEPFTEQLAKDFPKKLSLPLEDGGELTYDLPEDFTASVREEALEYFNHPDMVVNEQTVQEFTTLKKALYVYENLKDIMKHTYGQGKAAGTKETTAKFENPTGLENPAADVETTVDNLDETLMSIAKG